MGTAGVDRPLDANEALTTANPFCPVKGQFAFNTMHSDTDQNTSSPLRTDTSHGDASDTDINACIKIERIAAMMYDKLIQAGEAVVSMNSYEQRYNFSWKLSEKSTYNDDPFFVRRIYNEFEISCLNFCNTLDVTCTSLAGLGMEQRSNSVSEDMVRIRSHVGKQLYNMMCSTTMSKSEVVVKAREMEALYTELHVRKQRERINECIVGVRALSCIAAAAVCGSDMNEVMQHHYAMARLVCLNPPRQFTDQLHAVGISLNVLSACFASSGHIGVVGASSLAPSWTKAVDIVRVFFSHANVAHYFNSACVSTINLMRIECAEPDSSHAWCGVEVMDNTCKVALSASCIPTFDMVRALHPPAHYGGYTGKAIVVNAPSPPRALRVVRFFRMLVRCAEEGYFVPRCARASILLSSAARFRTENSFCLSKLSGSKTPALVMQPSFHCSGGNNEDDLYARLEANVCKLLDENGGNGEHVLGNVSMSSAPTIPVVCNSVVANNKSVTVPLKVERDYHICQSLHRIIDERGGQVFLSSAGQLLKASDGYFYGYKNRSVEQSVYHVITKKCIPQARTLAPIASIMEYCKCPPGQKGGGHINFDAAGAKTMKMYLETALKKMEDADQSFLKVWHASRSSRNKAKAMALSKMTKVKEDCQVLTWE